MSNKLLIVDDELEARSSLYLRIFQEPIANKNYSVELVPTGENALKLIQKDRKQEINLIILDLRLNGSQLSGVELANTLAELHIDKKIIVWTAYPHLKSDFSEKALKNILRIIKRTDFPSRYLREITDMFMYGQVVDYPSHSGIDKDSRLIGFSSIRKLAKSLTPEQRYQLTMDLLPHYPYSILKKMEVELPQKIHEAQQISYDRDLLKQWLAEQQRLGTISLDDVPPAKELDELNLEITEQRKEGRIYTDFFIRWKYNDRRRSKYINIDLRTTLPHQFQYIGGSPIILASPAD